MYAFAVIYMFMQQELKLFPCNAFSKFEKPYTYPSDSFMLGLCGRVIPNLGEIFS